MKKETLQKRDLSILKRMRELNLKLRYLRSYALRVLTTRNAISYSKNLLNSTRSCALINKQLINN